MRSEQEVRGLLGKLEGFNEAISKQLRGCETDGERFDELAGVFNDNSKTLSALQWVLGGDNIQIREQQ